jgi:hypothetical protein
MKNKQRWFSKILTIVIILIITTLEFSVAQTTSFRLKTADSLFRLKQYTQSFEHYEQMLKQKEYTPAMLLKMAYIQEGLLHTGQSMYYLSLYYIATRDKTTLEKMQELATKYNLQGYETSQTDQFLSFYQDYHIYISFVLVAFMIMILTFVIHTRRRLNERPVFSFIFLFVITGGLMVHLYYGDQISPGIVTNPSTYLMSGPSAAASVIKIIGDGHRIEILGREDVWLKIQWEEKTVFVKENNLLPIRL